MRRQLSAVQISVRIALVIVFVLLTWGTDNVFFILDANSHSASDTLRPFFLTLGPVWIVAICAARIVLRTR